MGTDGKPPRPTSTAPTGASGSQITGEAFGCGHGACVALQSWSDHVWFCQTLDSGLLGACMESSFWDDLSVRDTVLSAVPGSCTCPGDSGKLVPPILVSSARVEQGGGFR